MKTLYDVQQLLKQFGIVVYLGKRLYDIEMMKIELEALYQNALIDKENTLGHRHLLASSCTFSPQPEQQTRTSRHALT